MSDTPVDLCRLQHNSDSFNLKSLSLNFRQAVYNNITFMCRKLSRANRLLCELAYLSQSKDRGLKLVIVI